MDRKIRRGELLNLQEESANPSFAVKTASTLYHIEGEDTQNYQQVNIQSRLTELEPVLKAMKVSSEPLAADGSVFVFFRLAESGNAHLIFDSLADSSESKYLTAILLSCDLLGYLQPLSSKHASFEVIVDREFPPLTAEQEQKVCSVTQTLLTPSHDRRELLAAHGYHINN